MSKARGASHEHVSVMGMALCRAGGNPFLLPADTLRPFALYCLILIDTAKGVGMAEAAPIGFVLGTKPASSLEFHT